MFWISHFWQKWYANTSGIPSISLVLYCSFKFYICIIFSIFRYYYFQKVVLSPSIILYMSSPSISMVTYKITFKVFLFLIFYWSIVDVQYYLLQVNNTVIHNFSVLYIYGFYKILTIFSFCTIYPCSLLSRWFWYQSETHLGRLPFNLIYRKIEKNLQGTSLMITIIYFIFSFFLSGGTICINIESNMVSHWKLKCQY